MSNSNINLRYNEKKYAELLIKNGFQTQYKVYELKILAKYYKFEKYKKKEIKKLLYEFCEKHIENFNKVLYFKTINSVLNYINKKSSKLIIINEIPITIKEIDYIKNLDLDDVYKKILFTLLVADKLNKEVSFQLYGEKSKYNSFGGKSTKYRELFEISKIQNGNKKININDVINYLSQEKGVIEVWNKGKINMTFINQIETSDVIALTVKSFDDIGYYYDWYCELNNVVKCEHCDKLFKKRSNNHKMCRECWIDIKKIQTRYRVRKHRECNALENPAIP